MSGDDLRALETRLQHLEDERDIARLISSYGPLVDTGNPAVADLWLEDGSYDVDELLMERSSDIGQMVLSPAHQGFIDAGCAHFQGPVTIVVRGDEAEAVGYSLMLVRDGGTFRLRRVTANHWTLTRTLQGWRIARRTSRKLDGSDDAREVLARLTSIADETSL